MAMAYYNATDDPQKVAFGGESAQLHEETLQAYGPPPPNYIVERYLHYQVSSRSTPGGRTKKTVWRMRYKEVSSAPNVPWSYDHPLLPSATNTVILNESRLVRQREYGVFDIPFTYKTGDQVWNYNKSAFGALAGSFNSIKSKDEKQYTEVMMQSIYDKTTQEIKDARQNSVLYHPTDRDTMVWPDEPALSIVARSLDRSLIIFSPFVPANGVGSNRVYDRTNRPPIYARWSTGTQSLKPPVILGCLPKQVYKGESTIKVMWFSIEPHPNKLPKWATHAPWAKPLFGQVNLKEMAEMLGFPMEALKGKERVFLWSLVSLQRRMITGAVPLDTDMGCWLWQFWNNIVDRPNGLTDPEPITFKYDPARVPEYKQKFPKAFLTLPILSCLLLSRHMVVNSIPITRYAAQWAEAIDAKIAYQLDPTDQNHALFQAKMAVTRRIPL